MTSENIDRVLCRYFVNGVCRDGDRCQFSHSRNDRLSTICRYYQRGNCTYGSRCRYDHVRNDRPGSSRTTNSRMSPSPAQTSAVSSSNSRQSKNSKDKTFNTTNTNRIVNINNSNISCSSLVNNTDNNQSVRKSELRVEAPEFVPRAITQDQNFCNNVQATYSDVVAQKSLETRCYDNNGEEIEAASSGYQDQQQQSTADAAKSLLCPYNMMGQCWYGDACSFTHGDICDLCNYPVLHPTDKEHNSKHRQECLAEHEREMESAFAVAKSREKQCGICMEVVLEKADQSKQRFGVLPSCKHCFCLDCIRKWRQAKSFENKIIRACPECRTVSDFVVPSTVWVEEDLEKRALIETYHSAMKEKKCKYFSQGTGGDDECPFGNKCFYRHVKPDGTVVQGDSPKTIRQRLRQRQRARGGRRFGGGGAGGSASTSAADLYVLWHFLEERDAAAGEQNGTPSQGGGRNRNGRNSIGSSADWLWDELEYELDLLSITDDDSDSDVGGDFYDLILP